MQKKAGGRFFMCNGSIGSTYNFKSITNAGKEWILQTDEIKLLVNKKPFRLYFYNNNGVLLNGDDESLGISWRETR